MPNYIVRPSVVTDEMLIDFDALPHKINYSDVLIPLNELEASENVLNFALRQKPYFPFKNKFVKTQETYIGYGGSKNINSPYGVLEADAYSEWIEKFKDSERNFKKYFILDSLTQNQYDALVSLYHYTGKWDKVGTTLVEFNIRPYIENREWNHVGTALIYNGNQRARTQAEAKIMLLGDYGRHTPRDVLKKKGVQLIRGFYNRITDSIAKQQCEYVFYIETSRFLPGLSQSRMRQIVEYVRDNNITLNKVL